MGYITTEEHICIGVLHFQVSGFPELLPYAIYSRIISTATCGRLGYSDRLNRLACSTVVHIIEWRRHTAGKWTDATFQQGMSIVGKNAKLPISGGTTIVKLSSGRPWGRRLNSLITFNFTPRYSSINRDYRDSRRGSATANSCMCWTRGIFSHRSIYRIMTR